MELQIGEKKVKLRFSYSLIRALSIKWGIANVEVILAKIMETFVKAEEDIFSAIDTVTEIVIESAKLSGIEIDPNDVGDALFKDASLMLEVVSEFVNSMPKVTEQDVENLKKKTLSSKQK